MTSPAFAELALKFNTVFSTLPQLQQLIKSIQSSRLVFAVENGIEYCINAGVEQKLIESANKDVKLRSGSVPSKISALDQILSHCIDCLTKCRQAAAEATGTKSWTSGLERNVIENWRLFSTHVLDASNILPIDGLDLMLLMGNPENSLASQETITFNQRVLIKYRRPYPPIHPVHSSNRKTPKAQQVILIHGTLSVLSRG